jgi:hypothetical protein
MASAYERQKERDLAVEYQTRAVDLRLADPDGPNAAAAESLYRLGRLLAGFDAPDEAEPYLRRALELRAEVEGPDSPKLPAILAELSDAVEASRPDDPEALELLERLVELQDSSRNRARVAAWHAGQLNHELAIDAYLGAIELERSLPYPGVGQLANLRTRLAGQYEELGRLEEAEAELQGVIDLKTEQLGPDHPHLAYPMRQLAKLYVEEERWLDAEALLERAAALNERAWGAPETQCGCGTANLLQQVREALGKVEPAAQKTAEAADTPAKNPRLEEIEKLDDEARSLLDRGESAAARETAGRALELRRDTFGYESDEAIAGMSRLAELLRAQGRYAEAYDLYEERLYLLESLGEFDSQRALSTLHSLGMLARSTRENDDAAALLDREIEGRIALGQVMRVTQILESLGHIRLGAKDAVAAEAAFADAAERWRELAGPSAPEITRLRTGIARARLSAGRIDDATALLVELLDAEQERRYPDLHAMIQILQPLKSAHDRAGRTEQAVETNARLHELRELLDGTLPDETGKAVESKRAAGREAKTKASN